ncbi:hypothetical protein SAMN02799620_01346 [Mycolicibacterium fluoranthenivorans]|uniref:Uncharacterized protein n=1 Tax=Mycolicibacterium fluoranthenivorans TaxID=258505 RepID=A0A1G4VMD8_9MYCO|nr:hypothetical protein SAMN02799620_01346 [Mycolicibacterium fluoranthenivorans]
MTYVALYSQDLTLSSNHLDDNQTSDTSLAHAMVRCDFHVCSALARPALPGRSTAEWCGVRREIGVHHTSRTSASRGRQVPAAAGWEPADKAAEARSARARVGHPVPAEAAERHWPPQPRTPVRPAPGRHRLLRHRADYFFDRASHFLSGSCAKFDTVCTAATFVSFRHISTTTASRNAHYAPPVRELAASSEVASTQHVSGHIRFLARDGRPPTLTP